MKTVSWNRVWKLRVPLDTEKKFRSSETQKIFSLKSFAQAAATKLGCSSRPNLELLSVPHKSAYLQVSLHKQNHTQDATQKQVSFPP